MVDSRWAFTVLAVLLRNAGSGPVYPFALRLRSFPTTEVNRDRVAPLLQRGATLALAVEKWQRSGMWVISRSDSQYPERLKRAQAFRTHRSTKREASLRAGFKN